MMSMLSGSPLAWPEERRVTEDRGFLQPNMVQCPAVASWVSADPQRKKTFKVKSPLILKPSEIQQISQKRASWCFSRLYNHLRCFLKKVSFKIRLFFCLLLRKKESNLLIINLIDCKKRRREIKLFGIIFCLFHKNCLKLFIIVIIFKCIFSVIQK